MICDKCRGEIAPGEPMVAGAGQHGTKQLTYHQRCTPSAGKSFRETVSMDDQPSARVRERELR